MLRTGGSPRSTRTRSRLPDYQPDETPQHINVQGEFIGYKGQCELISARQRLARCCLEP